LASPRPPNKDNDKLGSPRNLTTGGGGSVANETLYDIAQRIAGVERSITYLEGMATDTTRKVDILIVEVATAKGSLRIIKWVLGIAGTLCVLLWGFVATIVTMAVKHYLNW
jgi:hypothetical protein